MFNKIVAFCIHSNDHKVMRKFYEETLQFKPDFTNGDFVSYSLGGVNIALLGNKTVEGMCGIKAFSNSTKSNHLISSEVNDLDKSIQMLKDKGVKVITEPKVTPWGQHVAYISDPEGNLIELSEPYAE